MFGAAIKEAIKVKAIESERGTWLVDVSRLALISSDGR